MFLASNDMSSMYFEKPRLYSTLLCLPVCPGLINPLTEVTLIDTFSHQLDNLLMKMLIMADTMRSQIGYITMNIQDNLSSFDKFS